MRRQGQVREERGHHRLRGRPRSVDAALGLDCHERHWVVGIIAVLGAVVSAYGTYAASEAQADTLNYQRKVAKNQATIARQNAEAARQAGLVAEDNERDQSRRILAAQRAAIGASGVQGEIGAPLLAQIESAETAELNARRVRFGAEMAARGQENEARGFQSEALLRGFESKTTRRLGYVQAGSSLLTGASKGYAGSQRNQRSSDMGGV
jgi:hypothetical protein